MPFDMSPKSATTAVERLLDDPIMDLLMACDGITRDDVLTVIEDVRHALRTRQFEDAA
ncbi:hypothetical protein [Azospirillum sp. sgz301742]